MLTGPHASSTGSVIGAQFQYNPRPARCYYYVNALDELRGMEFGGSKLGNGEFGPTIPC